MGCLWIHLIMVWIDNFQMEMESINQFNVNFQIQFIFNNQFSLYLHYLNKINLWKMVSVIYNYKKTLKKKKKRFVRNVIRTKFIQRDFHFSLLLRLIVVNVDKIYALIIRLKNLLIEKMNLFSSKIVEA